jgi:hypothetical protein
MDLQFAQNIIEFSKHIKVTDMLGEGEEYLLISDIVSVSCMYSIYRVK